MKYRLSLIILIVLSLSACAKEVSNNEVVYNELKILIDKQNNQIENLKVEIEELKQSLNEGELIQPFIQENRLLYMNSRIPFGVSLINDSKLPIKVYAYDTHLDIYYEDNEMSEYLIGYSLVSKLMGKDFNDNPDYFDNSDIVKVIDENFVVVKVISLGTDLDEETRDKVRMMLDSLEYY